MATLSNPTPQDEDYGSPFGMTQQGQRDIGVSHRKKVQGEEVRDGLKETS